MMRGTNHSIPDLGYHGVDGHELKSLLLKRMFQLLPQVQNRTCSNLESYNLGDEYMAFSFRRGDKASVEHFSFAATEDYIKAAQEVLPTIFNGTIPKIFVSTDDCSVMMELRRLKPHWKFFSECDRMKVADHGFRLDEAKDWSLEHLDIHFEKFFTELYSMVFAKHFIGVKYTTVSWFTFFLRNANMNSIQFVDTPETKTFK